MAFQFTPDAHWEKTPSEFQHQDVADVSVDGRGRVYLFARNRNAVLVYSPEGGFLDAWGDGIFSIPHAIRVIGDFAYCVDKGDHTVRKFTLDGDLLMTLGTPGQASDTGWDGSRNDSIDCAAGPFNACTSVAAGHNGDLYVSDGYGNSRIHRFSAEGQLKHSWGSPGTAAGEFHLPHGILVARDERVLVADRENDRIQAFDQNGRFLEEWSDVQRPCAIAEDADGYLYVAELAWRVGDRSFRRPVPKAGLPSRVSILNRHGKLVQRIDSDEASPCSPGSFVAPHGICVDRQGSFYVAELPWAFGGKDALYPSSCHQIQKFTRTTPVRSA
jgi:DNA-binding beta-propeller fold protein YncE